MNNNCVDLKKGNTKFVDEFSREVYEQTYKYGDVDKDINDTHLRVAMDLASVEKDVEYWTQKFIELQEDFKFVPGGRITSNAGTNLKGTTYINCFVDGAIGEDQDSMEGILSTLRRQALILKSEGGYGFCADFMRPRGGFIFGIGNETPGAVRMLDMWDTQSAVITEGSGKKTENKKGKIKIRKGAQMVTMSCWHPDIEEYVTAKLTSGRLTKFNMSVLITDELMEAVKNNSIWNLEFPDYELSDEIKEKYKKEWNGNIKEWKSKNYPTKVYKTFSNANELWDLIMMSTYNRNEPGVLFVDTMNKMNNLYYCEHISATNPCLTDDSWITTDTGALQIKDLIGVQFNAMVNGKSYISTDEGFYCTGKKKIYEITTNEGFKIKTTSNHPFKKIIKLNRYEKITKWVEVSDLKKDDLLCLNNNKNFSWDGKGNREIGWLLGSLLGDGNICNDISTLGYWGETKMELRQIAINFIKNNIQYREGFLGNGKENSVDILTRDKTSIKSTYLTKIAKEYGFIGDKMLTSEIEKTSTDFYKGFLCGWFDADGTVGGNLNKGISVRLASSILDNLFVTQRMLARMGIISRIFQNRRLEGYRPLPDGNGGSKEYFCKSQHELVISGENIILFRNLIGFLDNKKTKKLNDLISLYKRKPNKENFVTKIKEIKEIGEELVYDCTIPEIHEFDANGFSVHNCGEQILPIGGVCLLGSINLTQFIDFENRNWNYKKLKEIIPTAVRFMDNVNDKTNVPLETQKDNLMDKRRIGLGIMGYGSALMMLKLRYGSDEALKLTEELMSFIANTAYQASALIAKEKGVFRFYDEQKYLAGNFVKNLSNETIELIKKYGLRNSHLLSIQPTGNSSVFANNVSGGLEPLFLPEYIRTSIQPYAPEGLFKPRNINWSDKKYDTDGNTKWDWKKEGDENVMWTNFKDIIWKFDKSRGLLKETVVKDYAVRFLEEKNEWNPKAKYAATTTELGIDEHIKTMGIMAKYIDAAMSKTVNLPNNFPYVDFKKLYEGLYNTGTVKGGTTYRAGTMTTVLSEKKEETPEDIEKIHKTTAPKRPKSITCDLHQIMVGGENWIVLVGLLSNDPYEVFAFKKKNISIPSKIKHGKLIKIKSNKYDLEIDDFVLEDIKLLFESNEQEALTRMISTALRHGTDIQFIYDQLQKSEGHIVSFSKAIGRTLKKYIKEYNGKKSCENCLSNNVSLQEGCFICLDCGSSKCS